MNDGCLTLKRVNDAHDGDIKVCSSEEKKVFDTLVYITHIQGANDKLGQFLDQGI
jgi:hypothetical protein